MVDRYAPPTSLWRRSTSQIRRELEAASAGPGAQFHFVDIDRAFGRYDFKQCAGRDGVTVRAGCIRASSSTLEMGPRQGLVCDVQLTNMPLRVVGVWQSSHLQSEFCEAVEAGGLFSLDNMHPTSAGYSLMARAVADAMVDAGTLPRLTEAQKACPEHEPARDQCAYYLTTPGVITADGNLRAYEFISNYDERGQRRLNDFRALVDFWSHN